MFCYFTKLFDFVFIFRNRFTEIWCDSENSREDMLNIINHNLNINEAKKTFEIGKCILDFVDWFKIQSSGIR